MNKQPWTYHTHEDLAPGIRRLLRGNQFMPRFERLPLPVSRYLMERASQLTNPRRNPRLIETRLAPFPQVRVTLRRWEPRGNTGPKPVVLYLHGGGWVLGSSRSHRGFCELIADEAQCSVFSLDYRRAPEHPYPAAVEDADMAFQWLQEQREIWGWQDQPIVVAGDSAGGNLATILCRRRRDRGETLPDAQLLMYPVTDFAQNTISYQKYASGFMLTRSLMDWFILQYRAAGQHDHHDIAPLHCQDLRGLPPTFIGLASCDVLLDEGREYAKRLQSAGVPVTLRIFSNMIHAFVNLLRVPEALAAARECVGFLQDMFHQHQPTTKDNQDGQSNTASR
ncbi:MAG TPA: alpha/beta hydrolase [Oligoflexus sp.]|uniref:alpha/beta hydrolase n=1 Tax=Oligoflexus sp. TaxID=1971216 RepID=UPI002D58EA5F|nr:alpha/beta hydrolase [Oligoflexus sp.]HYX33856.1 alpha/beta hydrolase [Oligoflexus sp.]